MPLQLIANQTDKAGTSRIRERELESGRLVLRAVRSAVPAAPFLVRRASASVEAMERSPARAALTRAVAVVADVEIEAGARAAELRQAMVCYGGVLERHCLWPAAIEAYEAALAVAPADPELMLHLARAHRLAGARMEALELYRAVREVGGAEQLARFALVGEALLSADAMAALTAVLDAAEPAGESEVCAVALEERARLHRNAGHIDEATADYIAAADLYGCAQDRVRIAHSLADVMLARSDLDAAREALYIAYDISLPAQRPNAAHRLRAVARAQGDQLGLLRWPPAKPSSLVSLIGPRRNDSTQASRADQLRRWRDILATGPSAS